MAIADVDLEDRNSKSDTVQTLKRAKTEQEDSAQRTKKLKVEEINEASNFRSESNSAEIPSTSTMWQEGCIQEENEDDCTFHPFPLKVMKPEPHPCRQLVRCQASANNIIEDVKMNWRIVQVCAVFFCHFRSVDSFLFD